MTFNVIRLLPILSPPKDDSPEAALSGDVDEIAEDLKTEADAPPVTDATEED